LCHPLRGYRHRRHQSPIVITFGVIGVAVITFVVIGVAVITFGVLLYF
jgi:hypothetical protein